MVTKSRQLKYLIFLLSSTIFILGCEPSVHNIPKADNKTSQTRENRRVKTITSISFLTNSFSPDSLIFEEKVIKHFNPSGQLIESEQYIIDSTILYKHQIQKHLGDTLYKIEKDIGNVFSPMLTIDTFKFVNSLLVESKTTNSYNHVITSDGNDEVTIYSK